MSEIPSFKDFIELINIDYDDHLERAHNAIESENECINFIKKMKYPNRAEMDVLIELCYRFINNPNQNIFIVSKEAPRLYYIINDILGRLPKDYASFKTRRMWENTENRSVIRILSSINSIRGFSASIIYLTDSFNTTQHHQLDSSYLNLIPALNSSKNSKYITNSYHEIQRFLNV